MAPQKANPTVAGGVEDVRKNESSFHKGGEAVPPKRLPKQTRHLPGQAG